MISTRCLTNGKHPQLKRGIQGLVSRTIIVGIILAFTTMVSFTSAQEPTYNYDPTHKVGETLWKLDIGGELTISEDGKRMLVASLRDSVFYMVDLEEVTYQKLSPRFYRDNTFGNTAYKASNNLNLLMEQIGGDTAGARVWDLAGDTIKLQTKHHGSQINAVSAKYNCYGYGDTLYSIDEGAPITDFGGGFYTWFDNDRDRFYNLQSEGGGVQEYNAITKEQLRGWQTGASRGICIRPPDSDWLYVFWSQSIERGPHHVDAINTVTDERVLFKRFHPEYADKVPVMSNVNSFVATSSSQGVAGGHMNGDRNPMWTFDGASRTSQVFANPKFVYGAEFPKVKELNTEMDKMYHCWFDETDSTNIVCSAVIPIETSVGKGQGEGTDHQQWLVVFEDTLSLTPGKNPGLVAISISSIDGLQVLSEERMYNGYSQVEIALTMLPSGAFVCSAEINGEMYSATFQIVR